MLRLLIKLGMHGIRHLIREEKALKEMEMEGI